jgi:hypothetical protein
MVIVKQRASGGTSWYVYNANLTSASYALYLNSTSAQDGPVTGFWNNTAPTSSVFSIGDVGGVNGNGGTFVAYCWAEIAGFSRFGSYTGNGSSDGPFVYCGFRPKYVFVKKISGSSYWQVLDTSRSPYNVAGEDLFFDITDTEKTTADGYNNIDFLSNGFKIRNTNCNDNGGTYIFGAFAENPFKNALAR